MKNILRTSRTLMSMLIIICSVTSFSTIAYPYPLLTESEINALTYPRIFGTNSAKNTVIIRFNPQCVPCRNFWFAASPLFERLIPTETQVLLIGTGYKDDGIAIMQYTAMLTLYNQQLARKFLADTLKIGMYFDNIHSFFAKWMIANIEKTGINKEQWDRQYAAYTSIYKKTLSSIAEIDKRFSISGVPNVIVNTKVLEVHQKSVDGILLALQ